MERFQKIQIGLLSFSILICIGLFVFLFVPNFTGFSLLNSENNLNLPLDRIGEDQIIIGNGELKINLEDYVLSKYVNTGSMTPLLGEGATGIGIKPKLEGDIFLGDVISFWVGNDLIVHRVIDIGKDDFGAYYITKGDNSNSIDEKIRFDQIDSVLVAVIY